MWLLKDMRDKIIRNVDEGRKQSTAVTFLYLEQVYSFKQLQMEVLEDATSTQECDKIPIRSQVKISHLTQKYLLHESSPLLCKTRTFYCKPYLYCVALDDQKLKKNLPKFYPF